MLKRMLTIGPRHIISLSLPLKTLSKDCACVRKTPNMSSGELNFSIAAANGWIPRSCPVMALYSFVAASNTLVKLALEELAGGLLVDIGQQ